MSACSSVERTESDSRAAGWSLVVRLLWVLAAALLGLSSLGCHAPSTVGLVRSPAAATSLATPAERAIRSRLPAFIPPRPHAVSPVHRAVTVKRGPEAWQVGRSPRRDFTAVIDVAPTASHDAAGLSLAGATGAESKYTIEGVDVRNPTFGTLGATLPLEFIEEIDVREAGHEAKYGGASGGHVAIRRVSAASNELRGEVGARVTPRLAQPRLIGATDEALRVSEIDDLAAQLFAIVSGPIVYDRLHFTVGFAPGGVRSQLIQSFHRVGADKFAEQRFETGRLDFSYVAGLDFRFTPRQYLRITALGGPEFQRTAYRLPHGPEPNAFGNPRIDPLDGSSRVGAGVVNDHFGTNLAHTTVVALDYTGRSYSEKLEYTAKLGFSQFVSEDAWRLDDPRLREIPATQWRSNTGLDLRSMLEQDDAAALVPGLYEACEGDAGELACPVRTWLSGGLGEYDRDRAIRFGGDFGLTHHLDFAGTHELGYGGAFAWNQRKSLFRYSGSNAPDFYDTSRCPPGQQSGGEYCFDPATGEYAVDNDTRVNNNRLILVDGDDPSVRTTWGFGRARHELAQLDAITDEHGQSVRAPAYEEALSSFDYGVYVQDKWTLLPNLILNGGVRWELQDLRDIYGKSRVLLWDNVAPRVGLVYDWTDEGRSRLFVNYGHYYQPLPLQLSSRTFGGLINVARSYAVEDCENQTTTLDGVSHSRVGEREQPSEWCVDQPDFTTGAQPGAVAPRLRGQFTRQLVLGYEQLIGEDLVLGVRWFHSGLGRAVDDVSPDGLNLVLANPAGASRNFDAWTFHLHKRFARDWLLIGSYTYSRLLGNYDGYVDPVSGAINIGASAQFDAPELVRNSFGPLAGHIPHRFKLDGIYELDLRGSGRMSLSASVRVQSGGPVNVRVDSTLPSYRGAHVNYLLPRGAAGLLAPNYQLNLGFAYAYPLPRGVELEFAARLFNVTNAKATLRVDEIYSHDAAKPIAGGDSADLAHAKVGEAGFFARELVTRQGNFGVATRFQQPLAAQLELKLRF